MQQLKSVFIGAIGRPVTPKYPQVTLVLQSAISRALTNGDVKASSEDCQRKNSGDRKDLKMSGLLRWLSLKFRATRPRKSPRRFELDFGGSALLYCWFRLSPRSGLSPFIRYFSGLWLSFRDTTLASPTDNFVGLDNYPSSSLTASSGTPGYTRFSLPAARRWPETSHRPDDCPGSQRKIPRSRNSPCSDVSAMGYSDGCHFENVRMVVRRTKRDGELSFA